MSRTFSTGCYALIDWTERLKSTDPEDDSVVRIAAEWEGAANLVRHTLRWKMPCQMRTELSGIENVRRLTVHRGRLGEDVDLERFTQQFREQVAKAGGVGEYRFEIEDGVAESLRDPTCRPVWPDCELARREAEAYFDRCEELAQKQPEDYRLKPHSTPEAVEGIVRLLSGPPPCGDDDPYDSESKRFSYDVNSMVLKKYDRLHERGRSELWTHDAILTHLMDRWPQIDPGIFEKALSDAVQSYQIHAHRSEDGSRVDAAGFRSWRATPRRERLKVYFVAATPEGNATDPVSTRQNAIGYSADFASVRWGDETFSFTKLQRGIVGDLIAAYENGTPDIGEEALLTEAKPDGRGSTTVKGIFKGEPAWGTMIVKGDRKDTFRIADPQEKDEQNESAA